MMVTNLLVYVSAHTRNGFCTKRISIGNSFSWIIYTHTTNTDEAGSFILPHNEFDAIYGNNFFCALLQIYTQRRFKHFIAHRMAISWDVNKCRNIISFQHTEGERKGMIRLYQLSEMVSQYWCSSVCVCRNVRVVRWKWWPEFIDLYIFYMDAVQIKPLKFH